MLIEKSSLRTKNELFSTSFHRENVAINGQRKEGSAAAKNQHFCIAAFLQHFCFCSFNIFNLILKKNWQNILSRCIPQYLSTASHKLTLF